MGETNQRQWTTPVLVSTTLAVLSIVAGLIPFGWDFFREKAGLEVRLIGKTPIVDRASRPEKLQVLYEGRAVDSLYQATFQVKNTGRQPFTKSDFVQALQLEVTSRGNILDFKLGQSDPPSASIAISGNVPTQVVEIQADLINPGDTFRFSVFVSESEPVFALHGRVVGLREPTFISSVIVEAGNSTARVVAGGLVGVGIALIISTMAGLASRKLLLKRWQALSPKA